MSEDKPTLLWLPDPTARALAHDNVLLRATNERLQWERDSATCSMERLQIERDNERRRADRYRARYRALKFSHEHEVGLRDFRPLEKR